MSLWRLILVWSTGFDATPLVRTDVVISEELVSLDFSQWGVDPAGEACYRTADLTVEGSGPGEMSTWSTDGDGTDAYKWFGSATNGQLTTGTWYLGAYPWYAEFSE